MNTIEEAIKAIFGGRNVFVHGRAGTGKSTLLGTVMDFFKEETIIACPTGVSAINVEGDTYHSLFKLPLGITPLEDIKKGSKKTINLFGKRSPVKRFIIDEVGMIRLDHFLQIDQTLRNVRNSKEPFGGLQVILLGDFLQLNSILRYNEESVYKEYYPGLFPFEVSLWNKLNFININLTEVFRQEDPVFSKALNMVRTGRPNNNLLRYFNRRVLPNTEEALTLCMTNARAEEINSKSLASMKGSSKIYYAEIDNYKERPVPEELELKVGAKVLVCANKKEGHTEELLCANGDTGKVSYLGDDHVRVILDRNYEEVDIKYTTYTRYDYEVVITPNGRTLVRREIGSYSQIPLRLMYASSVHKTQGLTLDKIHLDLERGTFSDGQLYVALSRLKTYQGLTLERPIRYNDIKVNKKILDFLKKTFMN